MRLVWIVGFMALAACKPSEAEVLERNYEQAEKDGLDTCADAKNIAAAYAREGEQEKYDHWKLNADSKCLHESTLRSIGR